MNSTMQMKHILNEHVKELLAEGNYPIDFVGYVALVDLLKDLYCAANGYDDYADTIHGDDVHDVCATFATTMLRGSNNKDAVI